MLENDRVFTVEELATYLQMKPGTVYKYAGEGALPGFKVGSQWRFKKQSIDSWIERQEQQFNRNHKVLTN